MITSDFLIRVVHLSQVAASTSSPTPAPAAQLDVVASNYWLAVLLVVGSIGVICIALAFAFSYHEKLLEVIKLAIRNTKAGPETSSGSARSSGPVVGTVVDGAVNFEVQNVVIAAPAIGGPDKGTPSAKLAYSVTGVDKALTISWVAANGDPAGGRGASFATRFDNEGSYKVTATYTDENKVKTTLSQDVTIVAAVAAVAPSAPIILPFVIKNWGRLVIVIFGVGVISALMSTKVLDAAAGIGILGTLLGVGAVTATSGTSGDKPTTPPDD